MDTYVANTNKERGNQLTKMSPHKKYDGIRISKHEQGDPPKKDFLYSLDRPDNRWQRNKGGNWQVACKWLSITCKPSMIVTSKSMDEHKCISSR